MCSSWHACAHHGVQRAIVESVQVGLGITLLSRDAAGAELDKGSSEEWRHGHLPLRREWHVVGRAHEEVDPAAMLMLEHRSAGAGERSTLSRSAAPTAPGKGDSGMNGP